MMVLDKSAKMGYAFLMGEVAGSFYFGRRPCCATRKRGEVHEAQHFAQGRRPFFMMGDIMDSRKFHKDVYDQDHAITPPTGWIQWKGTQVCIDLHCTCGHLGHHDGDFFYFYKCPVCHRVYAVGQVVKLIPLNADQINFLKETDRLPILKEEEEEKIISEFLESCRMREIE